MSGFKSWLYENDIVYEIMFAFASLLYDNLRGGELNYALNIKTEALVEVFIFQTTFRLRGGYHTINTQTKILF
jgi:hypothetical protein